MNYRSLFACLSVVHVAIGAEIFIYQTDYTSASGFTSGNLKDQDGWLGQANAQVDPSNEGKVTSIGGPYDRNLHGAGARGGTDGNPNTTGSFQVGDKLSIDFRYQFTLKGNNNASLATVGFSSTYNPNLAPSIDFGFKSNFNGYDPDPSEQDDGNVKFFPDLEDSNNGDALIIEGLDVGVSPGTADGSTPDLDSDPLEIRYELTNTGIDSWEVTHFQVENLSSSQTFIYTGPTQTITYSGTDAFVYQQLAPNPSSAPNFVGSSSGITFRFTDSTAIPGLPAHGLTLDPTTQDLDENGLPDVWEALFGASDVDPLADSDSDGIINADEASAGTDPFDPDSFFKSHVTPNGPNQLKLAWTALAHRPGAPETSTDLGKTDPWAPQSGSPSLLGDDWELILPVDSPARFFRVMSTQSDIDGDGVADWLEPYFGFSNEAGGENSAGLPISYDTDNNGSLDTTLSGDLAAFNEIYRQSESGTRLTRAQAARFLLQASFGASTIEEVDHVARLGVEAWIDEQVALPATYTKPYIQAIKADWDGSVPDPSLAGYASNATIVFGNNFSTAWARSTIQGEDQLRQRVAFALSEILVASRGVAMLANQPEAIAHYYDLLLTHAFGNYEDLLLQVSLSPCQGHGLSSLGNRKKDLSINRFPDENFAREIMQLFSIGLWELHPDGTRKLDAMGEPIPTYNNQHIHDLARVFTGVNYEAETWNGGYRDDGPYMTTSMKLFGVEHDLDPKPIVSGDGNVIILPARTNSDEDALLDVTETVNILVHHPNTAPFISRQLIQFLVTSNPTPAYVGRVSAVFSDNGSGETGDLEAVVRAILLDDEARNPLHHLATPHFGQLREPTIRAMHLARILKLGDQPQLRWWDWGNYKDASLQEPMHAPSVFNYFRPDFRLYGAISNNNLDSPAFGIVDAYSSISFPNHLWSICTQGFKDGNGVAQGVDLSDLEALADNIPALIDHLSLLYCGSTLSANSREILTTTLESTTDLTQRARLAAYLVINSPEGTCLK